MDCGNQDGFVATIKRVKETLTDDFLSKLFNYEDVYKKIVEIKTLLLLRYEEAKTFATIATNAKDVSVQKAKEALDSANSANLSALFAGDRAEWIDNNTKEIVDNIELIKLSPQNAQIALINATIATNAKDVSVQKAKEALDSSNSANLSALFAGDRANHVDEVTLVIDREKDEILGAIDVHNRFIRLSKEEIDEIKIYLLQKAQETFSARDSAVSSARASIDAKNTSKVYLDRTIEAKNSVSTNEYLTKKYLDSTIEAKNIVIDLKNQTATFRDGSEELYHKSEEVYDETKVLYDELKDVGSTYDLKKELYTLRTGTIYEIRGDIRRP